MANIMFCCKCKTTWSKKETDLKFEILRISFNGPSGRPNCRGASYEWRYNGPTPCDSKIVTEVAQAKIEDGSAPSSNCDCQNACGGIAKEASFLGEESAGNGGSYKYTYQGYWRKTAGPSSCPSTVYGKHVVTYFRQYFKTSWDQPYEKDHLCGNICFSCLPATPSNKDKINSILNNWDTWTPPC